MVELAQVLEDEISGTVPALKVSSFITLKLISSASIPAAPANLTDSPSRQEQPKFNSQTFLYTISCPGLILAMAAIPVILNLQAGTAGLNLGSIGSMDPQTFMCRFQNDSAEGLWFKGGRGFTEVQMGQVELNCRPKSGRGFQGLIGLVSWVLEIEQGR